ncbi:L,D-transpeptidase [Solirubrobacter phytolaccae]|uniref:L,D-transpeptidase n=1 Tax=Solirubrobacter phytolaccae TaxID=1404360 RepID=A0A9X3SD95_9ACTN|nr:L,D-transpeptidase [Solirubrobacter phytolaccae]MDA0183425.1 L,D-transpeptidase [Solirubrobacter phytolaccae]
MRRASLALAVVATVAWTQPAQAERLSDEHTLSRWAYPERLGWARSAPSTAARRVVRLRALTEDGRPELYLALRDRVGADGRRWIELRLPRRPNGSRGWVPRAYLSRLRVVRTALEIDRTRLRAWLRRDGRVVWTARVGVGAQGTPTPAGRFYVREKLRGDGARYGPWAIGTSAYSALSDWPGGGVVGIHGTDRPDLIPGRPSHGCVRLANRDVAALVRRLPLGTPIWVH